jgi:hypothetical protein
MGCCVSKPEPRSRKKRPRRFRSLRYRSKTPQRINKCESEEDIKSDVSSVFDKYDQRGEGYLSETDVRDMIKNMAIARNIDLAKQDIERYAKTFMR